MTEIGHLQDMGKEIMLCCVPSHVGVERNERADEIAKKAPERVPEFISVPHSDWFTAIRRRRYQIWERK